MTSQTTTIHTPFADGRTVRDIVEHSPALIDEAWCRDLLRHTLDSLERQYATGAAHRPISPDTIVMLANNEPLLLPAAEDVGAASPATLAADLHALALVVHYAITAELPPDGPLGPRLYDNYSSTLTNGLDRCLGPNMRLRPKTAADMRATLGIEASSGDTPSHASTQATMPAADAAPALPAAAVAEAPPAPFDPAHAPAPTTQAAPLPEPVPRLHTPSVADSIPAPAPTAEPLLRTPAAAGTPIFGPPDKAVPAKPATTLEAATAARLNEEAARTRAPAAPARASASLQRWGWIAGAAIVLLAGGTALVSYLEQQEADKAAALSLPPATPAASAVTGLEPGETVVAPATDAPPAPDSAPMPDSGTVPADTPGTLAPGQPAATIPAPGRAGDAIVNGTTYKLIIKPWGTIYVDGIDRGVSPPVKRLTLGKGLHTIQIVNPNFPDHVLTVDAGSRESTTIQHDFTALPNKELP